MQTAAHDKIISRITSVVWVSGLAIVALMVTVAMFTLLAGAQQPGAVAEVRDEAGRVVGRATFTQNLPDGGVWIQVQVSGLTPGVHAIHIHTVGVCTAPGFLSAAGHFNPEARKHGLVSFDGPHAGDLPNMVVPASGIARYETANYRITMGPSPNSVFDADGSALVIHANPDDNVTDPTGNAGPRVVCGRLVRP